MISKYVVSLYISASYVYAVYLSSHGALTHKIHRDDPDVIKYRMRNIAKIAVLNIVLVPLIQALLARNTHYSELFFNLGLIPGHYIDKSWNYSDFIIELMKGTSLVTLLYIGPLIDNILYYLICASSPLECTVRDFYNQVNDIWGIRNHIFAPISEEIVYTAMLLTTYITLDGGDGDINVSKTRIIWEPSLYFGLAHAHHAYEIYHEGIIPFKNIIVSTTFQILYTTLFGGFTNYVFLRTGGNLWVCILLHSICNMMGIPQGSDVSDIISRTEDVSEQSLAKYKKYITIWNRVYFTLLLVGLALFGWNLDPLTRSSHSLL